MIEAKVQMPEVDKNSEDYLVGYLNGFINGYDEGKSFGYTLGVKVGYARATERFKQLNPNTFDVRRMKNGL